MRGQFNSFQRTMLEWNDLHPYSAVHVARIAQRLDAGRLRACIRSTLHRRGLNGLEWNRATATYTYHGGPGDPEIRLLEPADEPLAVIFSEMERQLNTPFPSGGPLEPFRFFLVPAGAACFLGVVYFHPIADAESVILLLREISDHYLKVGDAAPGTPPDLFPDTRTCLVHRHPGVLLRRVLALPRQVRNARRRHRPPCRDPDDFTNRLEVLTLDSAQLSALRQTASAWGLTVNDLLLALLLQALSPLAPGRKRASRRRLLAVGCIVNLRRDLAMDSRKTFGLFLGAFTVTHAVPDDLSLRDLAAGVHRQTQVQKRHRLYLGTPMELGAARLAWRFFSPKRRRTFYQKHHPIWGGITNMNLNPLWDPTAAGAPLDYLRAVSTGPATPLVLSVTTVGTWANIVLSYRQAVFSANDIERFLDGFRGGLAQLGDLPILEPSSPKPV